MNNINALILGSNGYIGIELVKLLLNHSRVKIKYLCGSRSVGKKLSTFDKYLINDSVMTVIILALSDRPCWDIQNGTQIIKKSPECLQSVENCNVMMLL